MGDHCLRDRLRWFPPPRRAPGRPARPPPHLHRGHRAVHRGLRSQRPVVVGCVTRGLPRRPGARRRDVRACRPLAADELLPGWARAQHRARHLGRRVRSRRSRRRAARRRADLVPLLAVDLLHQRPGRAGTRPADPALPAREPRSHDPPAFRCRRRAFGHVLADGAGVRTDQRDAARLGKRLDGRSARGRRRPRRRLRRHRASGRIAAPAVRGLPRHHPRRRSADHGHRRVARVLAVLPADALPPAGACTTRPHAPASRSWRSRPALPWSRISRNVS